MVEGVGAAAGTVGAAGFAKRFGMEVEVEGTVVAVGVVVLDGFVGGAKEKEGVDGGAVVGTPVLG